MANLGEIQTYISKRLIDTNGTAVSAQDIITAINESIRYWKYRRFWFNEVEDTTTLTEGSADFPYPDDFLVPAVKDGGFAIEYGNIRYPMTKVDKITYDRMYIANAKGLPRWYARCANKEYQCFYIPNMDYTVNRHYLKDYADLVSNTDSNDFTENADRLIKLWTLANLWQEFRMDQTQSGYYRTAATDEWDNLKVLNNKMNSAGKLNLHSNL